MPLHSLKSATFIRSTHFTLRNAVCKVAFFACDLAGLGQMTFYSLKLVAGPLPIRLGDKDLSIKWPAIISTRKALPLQIKSEGGWKSEAPLNLGLSRRDMMIYLTAGTLSGPTAPVEARIVKPEIKRKIREKLEMLREKAGLSKPKNEDGMKAPPARPSANEKKLSPSRPLIPLPNSKESVVEATLP